MSARNVKMPQRAASQAAKSRKAKAPTPKARLVSKREGIVIALCEETIPYRANVLPVTRPRYKTIDLFCGAGGITEGFRRAGFSCLYANDINRWAVETFRANHPGTRADNRPIEQVDAAALRRELNIDRGELDVIVGGPPCQGFSINAPERFLEDPRNRLFKHYIRFLDEFDPKTLLTEC